MMRGLLLCVALVSASVVPSFSPSTAHAEPLRQYDARGTIRDLVPSRKLVEIAHEKIDGFMDAMVMTFEAKSADQLAGLAVGDRVVFHFTVSADGRHFVLDSIHKP